MKSFVIFIFLILAQISNAQEYRVKDINPVLTLDVNAIVRKYDTQIWLHDYNDMTVKNKTVITVFNQKVMEQLNFYVSYDNYETVKDYYAIIYNEAGEKVKTLKKRDFLDISATGSNLYSDDRAILLNFTPTFYPYTIEFFYEKRTSSTAFVPGFYPYPYSNMSVEESSYTLLNEKEIPIVSKKTNLDNFSINIEETSKKFQYSVKNIRPISREELCPPYSKVMPWVRLVPEKFQLQGVSAEIKDWNDFGIWQREKLLKGRDVLDENTIARVNELVKEVVDPKEKAKLIYQFMQGKTRYISVQIGIGGWQPFPAKEVDKLGYGDCKGLTNYTKALLKTQGIDSYYTIVDSGPNGVDIEEDLVALQGDHVILSVPFDDELVFLECTSQDLPFNFLGTHTDDRKVLMITPQGGVFKKTHTYSPNENLQSTKLNAILDENLVLRGKVESESFGLKYYEIFLLEQKDQKEKELYYKNKLGFHNGLAVDGIELENDKDTVRFKEKLNFTSPSYTTKAGDRILLNPNLYTRVLEIPKQDKNRRFTLEIRRGYSYNDEINIQLPENYSLESLFQPFQLETEFGSYSISVSLKENRLHYKRKFMLLSGQWPKEKYNDYVNFLKQIEKKDKSKIVLINNK